MCLDCGCENANLIRSNPVLSSLKGINLSEMKPMVDKIRIGKDILEKNNTMAETNRKSFEKQGKKVINLMSSPGSGKTTLLCALSEYLQDRDQVQVLVGDLETEIDADRLKEHYQNVQQINTVSSCHLDATHLNDVEISESSNLLFIENIGNLVCPASFDLGESYRMAVISVTEGEEKPLKYPLLFKDSDICVITKTDLLPHLEFDLSKLEDNIHKINSDIKIIKTSSKNLEGLRELASWVEGN